MPRANALVGGVKEVARPVVTEAAREGAPTEFATVVFGGGRTGLLDLGLHRSRVWAEVLESLRQDGNPAYVEIDPESSLITEVLLPITYHVGRIQRAPDGLAVELIVSHARHSLRRSNPHYDELRKTLEQARKDGSRVLVTESLDNSEIIDARPVSGQTEPARRAARRR